jgi:hypothetical protein
MCEKMIIFTMKLMGYESKNIFFGFCLVYKTKNV